ncbi:dihydrofolate reductase [Streptomyces acidiscabies]|uniref:dihydrofolate reductase n=1 Tax=Streptomyces acidiscabies TaxID=42234 RepID=UPI0038F6F58D
MSAIAALGKGNVIGGPAGGMPWRIPEDSRRFRRITMGHPIIMGRVTFAEFEKPLDGRLNIVVTRSRSFVAPEGCVVAHSLDDALAYAHERDREEVFIGGGEFIYREALDYCDRLYLTLIHADFEGRARFPDYSGFGTEIERSSHDDGTYQYDFVTLDNLADAVNYATV